MKTVIDDHNWNEEEVKEFMENCYSENFNAGMKQGVKGDVKFEYVPECDSHGTKMFDDDSEVYYCPVCES